MESSTPFDFSQRPNDKEAFDYHRDYIALVPDGDILQTLRSQIDSASNLIRTIPADQLEVTHKPYAWKVRTVLEHCCDAERVFGYRVLRFAAGDTTELPGWDQDLYAASGHSTSGTAEDLISEFTTLREANLCLLKRLDPKTFGQIGVADGRQVTVRTLAWLMAGHWIHHEIILKKRLGL